MEKIIEYTTRGTCARAIRITLDGNVIREVKFAGGCSGNTQGVAALVVGTTAEEAIRRLSGIKCGPKSTSCPDQLSIALKQALETA